ncbi:MAG TPA: DUF4019 domain-containing protein [Terriglobales bacterium]|nr:DUF4019 domain-containing protein [Terriglobales bacterium]
MPVYRGMQLVLAVTLLTLLLGIGSTAHAQETTEQLGQQAADAWLALVDSGEYAKSWEQASSVLKSQIGKDAWSKMLKATLGPLGRNKSRTLKSAKYTTTLPGAPDGRYVVIQYESSFEHKQSAIETITPMLDKDGLWHVSGYYIK